MASFEIPIKQHTRSCMVEGRPGVFHLWEQYSQPVQASPMIGGPPAGVISYINGIVEFADGVKRVDPCYIEFTDEEHAALCAHEKWLAERNETSRNLHSLL